MKRISTTKLLGLLVLLVLIYVATEFFGNKGRSQSFREELVSIDTTEVSQIEILKDTIRTSIVKTDEGWRVSTNDGPEYSAQESRVKSALSSLQTIEPARIASRNPEKWQEFQVDSTGTRVQVYEGNKKTLDIVIGRFGMQGQRQFHSYVRLSEDDNTYVAENFMGFSIPTDENSYRNQSLISISKDSVNLVRFVYPADSSFSLEKSINGNWISDDFTPDSTEVVQFINSMSRLTSSKFDNEANISGLEPTFRTIVELSGNDPVEISAIAKNDTTYIITSSQNPEGKFSDPSLFEKIFRSKSSFYTEVPEKESGG